MRRPYELERVLVTPMEPPWDLTGRRANSSGAISGVKNLQCFRKGEKQKEKEGSQGSSDGRRREGRHDRTIAGERKEKVEQKRQNWPY